MLGDQFEMIAAPWLVLNLTHDPLALGTVLALSSIPRAAFMLLGGAISDRFSARTIMLISDTIRLALTAAMALLVYTGKMQVWQLYAFALLFGLVSGFFNPAANSMVPHIVEKDDLQAGNALIQGTAQLTSFVGPMLAGGLIALFASGQSGLAPAGLSGDRRRLRPGRAHLPDLHPDPGRHDAGARAREKQFQLKTYWPRSRAGSALP